MIIEWIGLLLLFFVVMWIISRIEKHYEHKKEYEKPWFLRKLS